MRQSASSVPSAIQARPLRTDQLVKATQDDRYLMIRGLVHGVILSLLVWVAVGTLAFTLH